MKRRVFIVKLNHSVGDYNGRLYRFKGASGWTEWPMDDGAFLAEAGAWNFLWRLGYCPVYTSIDKVLENAVQRDTVFICASVGLSIDDIETCRELGKKGCYIVLTGPSDVFVKAAGFPDVVGSESCPNPYAALGYDMFGEMKLICPPRWSYLTIQKQDSKEFQALGRIFCIEGNRCDPSEASMRHLDAPAVIIKDRFIYLNANPFAALQAWLQGQEDIIPWLNWRSRMHWLDEWVADVADYMFRLGALQKDDERPGFKSGERIVIIRHDLDHSIDTEYLEEEIRRGIPAVYAVLDDKNMSFWLSRLGNQELVEIAFHYSTVHEGWPAKMLRYARKVLNMPQLLPRSARSKIVRKGLYRQIIRAYKLGIGIRTIHRHWSYIFYPEYLDALNYASLKCDSLVGASSFFRGHVYRWGFEGIDNYNGTAAYHPDNQCPFWMPFRLAHAGLGGQMLDTWESSSVSEIEPLMFEQLIKHGIPYLEPGIFTINYHPAHTRHSPLAPSGMREAYERVLDIIDEEKCTVATLNKVYSMANQKVRKDNVD